MRIQLLLVVSFVASGCGGESLNVPPVTTAEVAALSPPTEESSHPAGEAEGLATMQPGHRTPAAGILVLETTKLDRYAEVIGVVDMHEAMGDERAALQKLRERASAMGADAVIGVEFHHGEGEGEPTHLSGMAVRFVEPPVLPIH